MRLFWKHILRSFLRRPFQPLLILLTVLLATSITVAGLQLSVVFTEHSHEAMDRDRELGNILITMRGDTDQRLLFPEDAERVVGERGQVLGEFRLSGFLEGEATEQTDEPFINLSALDLERADAYYQFHYTEYGSFTEKNLDTSAIISEKMARTYGLSVGDVVRLRVLDTHFSYTVEAVARESGLFKERDMLVSLSSLRRTLASRIPTVASLGTSFSPATRLMINVDEGCDVAALCAALERDPAFASMHVSVTGNRDAVLFLSLMQNIVLWLPCVLLLFLSALMLISCMNFLHAQRGEETALFCAAGASRRHLLLLTVAESGLYGVIGSLMALPLAAGLLRVASGLYEWIDEVIVPTPLICLIGCGASFLLLLGCTVRHFTSRRRLSLAEELQRTTEVAEEPSLKRAAMLPIAILVVCAALLPVVSVRVYYVLSIVMMLFLMWLMYMLLPPLFRSTSRLFQRLLARCTRPHGWMTMGLKNLHGCFALRHVGRVLTLFLALYATLMLSISILQTQLDGLLYSVDADYVAAYADDQAIQRVEEMPQVKNTLQLSYFSAISVEDTYTAIGLSTKGDREGLFSLAYYPEISPTGDEIAISKGFSVLSGKKVGDTLSVTVEGVSHVFTITEILKTNTHMIVFDVETLGLRYDYLCIDMMSDAPNDIGATLGATLEERGAFLLGEEEFVQIMGQSIRSHVTLLRGILWIAAGLILLGAVNLLLRQYRERREERTVLMINGMTRAEIIKMHAFELVLLLLLATLFSAVGGLFASALIDLGVRSFGMVLFL